MATSRNIKKEIMMKAIENIPTLEEYTTPKVQPLNHEFGNGDMNILKDKINEIKSL